MQIWGHMQSLSNTAKNANDLRLFYATWSPGSIDLRNICPITPVYEGNIRHRYSGTGIAQQEARVDMLTRDDRR